MATKHWFHLPEVGVAATIGITALFAALSIYVSQTKLGSYIKSRITTPLLFQARASLSMSPNISSKLRILSIDDSTFSLMDRPALTIYQWAQLLEAIDARQPRTIIIDKMFSKLVDPNNRIADAIATLSNLNSRVAVGAFVTPRAIMHRSTLSESLLAPNSGFLPSGQIMENAVQRKNWYAYGPDPRLAAAFPIVGHFNYGDLGEVAAAYDLGRGRILPHLAIAAFGDASLREGMLHSNGRLVPTDASGWVPVNFLPPAELNAMNLSLRNVLKKALSGEAIESVKAGDIVLLLPFMYTGNTDFKPSPFGQIPGGFVLASLINSIATDQWLRPYSAEAILIFVFSVAGAYVGLTAAPLAFMIVILATIATWILAACIIFSFANVVVGWFLPALAFVACGTAIFLRKLRGLEHKTVVLNTALSGSVKAEEIQDVVRKPSLVRLDAAERVVTVMFVDLVGFSFIAERLQPRQAFQNLKDVLGGITRIIQAHNGIIDRTLGDGLLCYFGFRFDTGATVADHAEAAVQCGIEIQRENLKRNLFASNIGQDIAPLRIGINTSSVFLGDLGSQGRIDFSIFGHGVNLAKRLESNCPLYSLLISATTAELLTGDQSSYSLSPRLVRIKHNPTPIEAFEVDPFSSESELRLRAIRCFENSSLQRRRDHRWTVPNAIHLEVLASGKPARILDFSRHGLQMSTAMRLETGAHVDVHFRTLIGDVTSQFPDGTIKGLIRWTFTENNVTTCGLQFLHIDEIVSDKIVRSLLDLTQAQERDHIA